MIERMTFGLITTEKVSGKSWMQKGMSSPIASTACL